MSGNNEIVVLPDHRVFQHDVDHCEFVRLKQCDNREEAIEFAQQFADREAVEYGIAFRERECPHCTGDGGASPFIDELNGE